MSRHFHLWDPQDWSPGPYTCMSLQNSAASLPSSQCDFPTPPDTLSSCFQRSVYFSIIVRGLFPKGSSMLFFSQGKKKNNTNSPASVRNPTVTKHVFRVEEGKATHFRLPLALRAGRLGGLRGNRVCTPRTRPHPLLHALTLSQREEERGT